MDTFNGDCQRCFKAANITTMSWFNTDILCIDCAEEETHHPRYREAVDAERQAVLQGNYNFEGIGYTSPDGV